MNKKLIKTIIALIVSTIMTLEIVPISAFAEIVKGNEPILLEYVTPDEDTENTISIGTLSTDVDEGGSYILTLVRNSVEGKASVTLKTVDLSAKYGEDYIIKDNEHNTVKDENDRKTILEQASDKKEQQERIDAAIKGAEDFVSSDGAIDTNMEEYEIQKDSFIENINNIREKENINSISSENDLLNEISDITNSNLDDTEEYDKNSSSGKSSLAVLKEAQTGRATRKTSGIESVPFEDILTQGARNSFGEMIESSSSTIIEFEDGESIKQVVVEILDDDIAEGMEIADFVIADASDNWNIGSSINCTLTINDDEAIEHSLISFSQSEYNAENGTAKITLTREGAEYSLVTAMVRTIADGNAQEGKNYSRISKLIEFAPYDNEQTISIPVSADKEMNFSLELYDIKGGEAGTNEKCKINIKPAKKYNSNEEIMLLANDDGRSTFNISIDGVDYAVYYNSGDNYGDIVDERFNPSVTIGRYFFPYPKGQNNGTFSYNLFFGDTGGTDRDSMYVKKGEKECGNDTGAGYLYWYNWKTWQKGGSELKAADDTFINTTPYQYISVDMNEASSFGGGQYTEVYLTKNENSFKTKARGFDGEFNRQMTNAIPFLSSSNLPVDKDINLKIKVQDRQSDRTPKLKLYVYGIAAVYKKYKIDLEQPAPLTYIDGEGIVSKQPAVVEAAEGHSTRYFGQDYQINVRGNDDNEIYGKIKAYEITIGEKAQNKVTFTYTPSGNNKTSISINEDFIKLIDKNAKEITNEGSGFYTRLSIKPVFEYINTNVNVLTNDKGHFTSSKLTPGQHSFHVGDKINLGGVSTADGYEYIGYNIEAFKNSSDSQPIILNDVYKTSDSSDDLSLVLTSQRYNLKPNFSEGNYIGIKLTDNAKKYLKLTNIASKNDVSANIMHNMEARGIEYALITDVSKSGDEAVKPVSGKVYTIEAKSNDNNYRAVYMLESDSAFKIVGNCFDYTANSLSSRNIIIVDAENINPKNEKIFEIDGYTMIPDASVRSTSQSLPDQPASSIQLTAGGEFIKTASGSSTYFLSRKSTSSDEKGAFSIKGIKGYDGDRISVLISNGDVEKAEYITLNSKGIEKTDIQYNEVIDNNGTMTDTPVVKAGYAINAGSIYMPVRSALAPYVSNVTYTVEQLPDYTYDTRNNEVAILGTYAEFTADVVKNSREIRAVIFRTVHKNGAYEEKRVNATNVGQNKFTARYKLDTEFESGDMLYVSIVDNEDRVFVTNYIDEETGEEKTGTTTDEKIYYSIYTGLSFYIPTLDVEPQTFDYENLQSVNVPILGDIAASQKTGAISFDKTFYGPEGTPNRPYTYSFYFSPGYSTMAAQTAQTTLANIKKGQASAANSLKNSPTEEEKALLDDLNKTYGGNDASKAGFEKQFSKLSFKKSLSNITKQTPFDVHAMLLLSFDYFYDNESNLYVLTSGQYSLGAMFSVAKCMYTTIYGVPVYLKVSGYLGANYSGMYVTDDKNVISQYDFSKTSNIATLVDTGDAGYITTTFGGSASVGVGLCGVVGARGIVNTAVTAKFNMGKSLMTMTDDSVEGFLFKLGGGFGIDLFLFTIEYTPSILTYGTGCYKKVAENSGSIVVLSADGNGGNIRNMNAGTSDMSNFGNYSVKRANGEHPVAANVILENARERSNPKITTLADGRKLLVFIGNDGSKEPNNSCLMYSISDEYGSWSAPQKVDGNGTSDVLPEIITFDNNKKAAIIWSDANKTFEAGYAAKDVLASLDLAYRVFNSETGALSEKAYITSDNYMDTGASFYYDEKENKLCCYYVKRDIKTAETEQDIADVMATYSTIACRKYDINSTSWDSEEILMDIPHDRINDPLIIDFNAIKNSFEGQNYVWMSYSVDEDEDLMTSDDREVYVILEDIENSKTYYPIKMTNNNVSDVRPKLMEFDGNVYLSWIENGKVLKMTNLTGIFEQMKNEGHLEEYLSSTENDWYKKTASELGISSEEYDSSIYQMLSENNICSLEKDFSTEENIDRAVSEYQLYNDNDKNLYMFWTENGYIKSADENASPESAELYGAVLEVSEEEDKYSSWSNAVQITDFEKYIDEFNVTFDSDGNMSMVSNLFTQNIDDAGNLSYSPNNLVEVDFSRECALAINEIEFDKIPQFGKEVNISFDITNTGLLSSDGYDVEVNLIRNGASENIYAQSINNQLVSGYKDSYNVLWEVPEDISSSEIEVKVYDKTSKGTIKENKAIDIKSDITVTNEKTEFDENGKLYYSATITNSGNTASGNIAVKSYKNSSENTEYGSYTVGSLGAGESRDISYELISFSSAAELTKYGSADIVNSFTADGNEEKSTVVRAIALNPVDIVVNNGIYEMNITAGKTETISAEIIPQNTLGKEIAYSCNNSNIAKVTEDGKIIPVGNGSAEITLLHTSSGFTKTITVNVSGVKEDTTETIPESTTENTNNSSSGNKSSSARRGSSLNKADKTEKTEDKIENSSDLGENDETPQKEDDMPFLDVSKDAWYSNCVKYVYENGLFKGISNTLFGPDVNVTRGMLLTVLGRKEDIDTSNYTNVSYTDVNADMYYAPYIEWATANNIVKGFGDGIFMPDENVTREQLTRIIKNYISYTGKDTETEETELPFKDTYLISDWAMEGVQYCYKSGIVYGDNNGMFNPKDNASRVELASILMKIMTE